MFISKTHLHNGSIHTPKVVQRPATVRVAALAVAIAISTSACTKEEVARGTMDVIFAVGAEVISQELDKSAVEAERQWHEEQERAANEYFRQKDAEWREAERQRKEYERQRAAAVGLLGEPFVRAAEKRARTQ